MLLLLLLFVVLCFLCFFTINSTCNVTYMYIFTQRTVGLCTAVTVCYSLCSLMAFDCQRNKRITYLLSTYLTSHPTHHRPHTAVCNTHLRFTASSCNEDTPSVNNGRPYLRLRYPLALYVRANRNRRTEPALLRLQRADSETCCVFAH